VCNYSPFLSGDHFSAQTTLQNVLFVHSCIRAFVHSCIRAFVSAFIEQRSLLRSLASVFCERGRGRFSKFTWKWS